MPLERIEEILKSSIGLHPASVGPSAIRAAVSKRMAACDIHELDSYTKYLQSFPAELRELIEVVVVPETWFFRDQKPFVALKELAQEKIRSTRTGPLNILSLPCSTGEEAYSIAITLLEAGFEASLFSVDAFDICQHSLEFAKAACYGPNSFRGQQDPSLIARYFESDGDRRRVAESARKQVRFDSCNLLNDGQRLSLGHYDFVFCRNLLIYFDEATKAKAFRRLHSALKEDGVLFLGHAECASAPSSLFEAVGGGGTFTFRKASPKPQRRLSPLPRPTSANLPRAVRSALKPSTTVAKDVPSAVAASSATEELENARRLANEGRLQEAREICERIVVRDKEQPEAYFLLGMVEAASGHDELAELALRKAIYLEPRHYDALVHLALLLNQRGDAPGAELLMRRAERSRSAEA